MIVDGYLQAKEFHPDKHAMAAAEEKVSLINWLVAWSTIAGEDGVQDERDSGCALLSLRPRQVSELINFSKSIAPTQEGRIPQIITKSKATTVANTGGKSMTASWSGCWGERKQTLMWAFTIKFSPFFHWSYVKGMMTWKTGTWHLQSSTNHNYHLCVQDCDDCSDDDEDFDFDVENFFYFMFGWVI